jgi:hypothetical protein
MVGLSSRSSASGLVCPETVNLGPLERPCSLRFIDGDALAEPGYHVAGQLFERLPVVLLFVCHLDQVAAFAVLQQQRGDLLGCDQPLILPVHLPDDASEDRENVAVSGDTMSNLGESQRGREPKSSVD